MGVGLFSDGIENDTSLPLLIFQVAYYDITCERVTKSAYIYKKFQKYPLLQLTASRPLHENVKRFAEPSSQQISKETTFI